MKKLLSCFLCFILFMYGGTAIAAGSTTLITDVKGKIETGQAIQILINVANIDSFYAGAASIKYDPKVLEIISFEKGDLITKKGTNVFDVGNKIDNTNGIASFGGFTCIGQTNGFSGSGTFLKINAKVLKKDSFHIKSVPLSTSPNDVDNLKIQLCDKDIKLVNYEFKGYEFKVSSNGKAEVIKQESTEANSSNNNSNTKASVNSTVNKGNETKTKQGSNVVNTDTNSNASDSTNTSTDPLVNNDSVSKQGSNVVNPNTNSTTKTNSNTNSPVIKENGINKSNLEINIQKKKSVINDAGITSKTKPAFSGNYESTTETEKKSGWRKGVLIGATIALVLIAAGGTYFYRKKH
ncbi:cohesin domain-containing protein [Clostridium algoriphilum]|uniref:cohesin domain-containing protein n=1 Tax=Clostridium algoriphilum TaxID=198347 RepID=UPI001CF21EC0|nr:cohesin domain-containing protein [Clostridium algoriphilum]MCB2293591.1 cohesin domain-containing protein [Clostridium algoriphilum]